MRSLKKSGIIFFIVSLIIANFPNQTEAITESSISAQSAVLIEQSTGRVLFAKQENEQRRIASITKIMTAILAIESGKMDDVVTVSKRAEGTEGSSLYLKAGDKIKLEDLVYGLMLRSGNDGAVAIAEKVGGSLEGFVFLMNQKAKELGMKNTVFANPHGLDDHENHYSSAYDMALLTQYAMENKTYRKIASTKIHKADNPNGEMAWVWRNKNKLLTSMYKYSTGGKTGYTKRAKRTLVSTASKDGLDLIAVTLNAPNDWNDHMSLFDWAFNQFKIETIDTKGKITGVKDDFYKDKVYVERDFTYPLTTEERKNVKTEVKLMKPKVEWENGAIPEKVGDLYIYMGDKTIGKLPVYYKGHVSLGENGFFSMMKDLFWRFLGVHADG